MVSTTAERNRRDHYSPQGYLRGFIHPKRLKAQRPLWVFDVSRQRWQQRSPTTIAWARGFYDYPPASRPDGTAEQVFLRPENEFPTIRERIRAEGFPSWVQDRDGLIRFAAMLSARSPMYLDQATSSIQRSLAARPDGAELSRNYALTTMRAEVEERFHRWKRLHWALRFTTNPAFPVVACDQSVGMDGRVGDIRLALQDPGTTLFFPVSWDMCLFGSPAVLNPVCAEFLEADLLRLQSFIVKQARLFVVSPLPLESIAR